jgi:hypothetical protein
MSWVAAGVASAQLTVQGFRFFKSRKDKKKAEEALKGMQLPSAETSEYKQNEADAKARAQEGLAEPSYQRQKEAIDRSTGAAMDLAKTGNMGTAVLPRIVSASTGAYSDLTSKDAMARAQQRDRISTLRSKMDDRKYQQDMLKYNQEVASQQGMLGAAIQTGNETGGQAMATGTQMAGLDYSGQGKSGDISFEDWNKMTPDEQKAYKEYQNSTT